MTENTKAELEALRQDLIEDKASGDAGPLDFAEIRRDARRRAGLAPEKPRGSEQNTGRVRDCTS